MWGTLVCSLRASIFSPSPATLTPAFSSFSSRVKALRPMANKTVSYVSVNSSLFSLTHDAFSLPSSSFSIFDGLHLKTYVQLEKLSLGISLGAYLNKNLTPRSCMADVTMSAICWSKPRSTIERTITVASKPRPFRKPAHSRPM